MEGTGHGTSTIHKAISDLPIPDLPDVTSLNPQMMTALELQSSIEQVFDWLQAVEALDESRSEEDIDEATVQRIRDAANVLLLERRERHSDEGAPRGG